MNKTSRRFHSPLAFGFSAFVAYKHSLGRRFHTEEKLFALFDRYLVEQRITKIVQITPEVVDGFVASRPRHIPRSYNQLLGTIRRLFEWMVLTERLDTVPLRAKPRRNGTPSRPFLFDTAQARDLLVAASRLPDTPGVAMRGHTYEMIFALLYALGLRVGELTRLRGVDVDLQEKLLVIRETKFGKSRYVPFGPRVEERLSRYLQKRQEVVGRLKPEHAVFTFSKDGYRQIRPKTISWTFHKLVFELHLNVPPGIRPPHLHCLRHSFAVATLLRWYRNGINPAERLLYLSTFLGHVSPESTAVYLTITDELLQAASKRYEHFAALNGVGS